MWIKYLLVAAIATAIISVSGLAEGAPGKRLKKLKGKSDASLEEDIQQTVSDAQSAAAPAPSLPAGPIPGTVIVDHSNAFAVDPEIDRSDMNCRYAASNDVAPVFSFKGIDLKMSLESFYEYARQLGGQLDPEELESYHKGLKDLGYGKNSQFYVAETYEDHAAKEDGDTYGKYQVAHQMPVDPLYVDSTRKEQVDYSRQLFAHYVGFDNFSIGGLTVTRMEYRSGYKIYETQNRSEGDERHECSANIKIFLDKKTAGDFNNLVSALKNKYGPTMHDFDPPMWGVHTQDYQSQVWMKAYSDIAIELNLSATSYVRVESAVNMDDF